MRNLSTSLAVFLMVYGLSMTPEAHAASWFTTIPSEIPETPVADWVPEPGDSFLVDTKTNIGYLIHETGGFTSFPVATGQRKVVRYIGRVYNASTPNRRWVSESKETKGDHITFGAEGTFLRLSYDGEGTSYGIHTHAYAETMLSHQMRYRSMGCVIVSSEQLQTIVETYEGNGGRLDVLTVDGFGEESVNFVTLKTLASEHF